MLVVKCVFILGVTIFVLLSEPSSTVGSQGAIWESSDSRIPPEPKVGERLSNKLPQEQPNDKNMGVMGQVRSVAFIGSDLAWLVTLGGDLWRTQNAGVTWEKSSRKPGGYFVCVTFVDELHGWAVGENGIVFYTDDGGKQWHKRGKLNYPQSGIVADRITFVDKLHGWAVGGKQDIWSTQDGGINWELFSDWQDSTCTIRRIKFFNSKMGWLACHSGLLSRTDDGGKSWTTVSVKSDGGVINDVFFINESTGWVVGYSDINIHRTTDGGENWELLLPFKLVYGNGDIESLFFVNENEGWIVGEDKWTNKEGLRGIVLHTKDGGKTWKPARIGNGATIYWWVHFTNASQGWVIDSDAVYRTNDSGKSWNEVWNIRKLK